MIDPEKEKLLTFHQVRKLRDVLPRRRLGKQLDLSTLYRWWKEGLAGVHLEVLSMGSTPATSLQALFRFFAGVAEAKRKRSDRADDSRAAAADRSRRRKSHAMSRTERLQSVQRELQEVGM